MVLDYYKLNEQPFGVTPDPRFLYASETHREALSSLIYGIQSGLGFVALTATPGMGKTTILFEVLGKIQDVRKVVFIFQTISSPADLFRALLIDLGITDLPGSVVEMQSRLNEALVHYQSIGKSLVVVIDEAQNLDDHVLEAVRMLSNFETANHKLMQIILSGQLQFADKLREPQLLQLRQRISIFAHLKQFSADDCEGYIRHRLQVAGYTSADPLFTKSALALIVQSSNGIPRNINNICFNALSLGCALRRRIIDSDLINEVLVDLCFLAPRPSPLPVEKELIVTRPDEVLPLTRSKAKAFYIATAVVVSLFLFTWGRLHFYRGKSVSGVKDGLVVKETQVAPVPAKVLDTKSSDLPPYKSVEVDEHQTASATCVDNSSHCSPRLLEELVESRVPLRVAIILSQDRGF